MAKSRLMRRGQSRSIILISMAIGAAVVSAAVIRRAINRGTAGESTPTTTPAAASDFSIASIDDLNFTLSYKGAPILHMIDGYLVRFRCNPRNDHWVGTAWQPLHLAWSPLNAPKVVDLRVATACHSDSFEIKIEGRKPELDGIGFTTRLSGKRRILPDGRGVHESIEYRLASKLDASPAAVKRALGIDIIEYLDPWLEGIFWPERDGHDREIYDYILFGNRGSVRYTPKLHIFPSLRDGRYETHFSELDAGFVAVVDLQEPDLYFRILNLSGPGEVGICWWTWDPNFSLTLDDNSNAPPSFEMTIDELPASITPGVMQEPTNRRIPFELDPDYQVPSFRRDGVNRFDDMLDASDEWGWEQHSRACTLDRNVGFGDMTSVTIQGAPKLTTAWYTRALGSDYFDHRRLIGGHAVSAVVRTRDATEGARIGVLCYNGPETWLYEEPDPVAVWSERVTGTTDWTPVSIQFDATGYKRFKLVLEHSGPGQSWFDNVELRRDPAADGIGWHDRIVDWRGRDWTKPQVLPYQALKCSQPKMLEDPTRLIMAWRDCSATSSRLQLPAGRYRLTVNASGDGCEFDPPQLQLAFGKETVGWTVTVGGARTHAHEFTAREESPTTFSLRFINDGPCKESGRSIDKNVYINEIAIERIDPRPANGTGTQFKRALEPSPPIPRQ